MPGLPDRVRIAAEGMRPTFVTALVVVPRPVGRRRRSLVDVAVFARLRRAPALARVVASLGLMLFLLAMAQARFEQGAAVLSVDSVLPTATVDVLGVAIPRDRLLLAGLAVVAAGALAALYRFTRFGLATRGRGRQRDRCAPHGPLARRPQRRQLGARLDAGHAGRRSSSPRSPGWRPRRWRC